MSKKFTVSEEEVKRIIELFDYGQGMTQKEIGKIYGVSDDTIRKILKENGIKKMSVYDRLSEEEKQQIVKWYLEDEWEKIFDNFHFMNKNRVHHVASRMGVKKEKYFWNKDDVEFIKEHYNTMNASEIQPLLKDYHTVNAISAKAKKLGLTQSKDWMEEEIEIIKQYYSILPTEEFYKIMTTRTSNAVVCKAMQLGIKSYEKLRQEYTQEEEQFIIDNFGVLSDEEIAQKLNRGVKGISDKRRKLGCFYFNKDYSKYEGLSKLFRGHIQDWKDATMEKCDYKCIITGSKEFAIHHLYGFNNILSEVYDIFEKKGILKSTKIEDYSKEELEEMLTIFKEIHSKYPLGVCLHKDIHKQFHDIYGAGGNTAEQFNHFMKKYYSDIVYNIA